jgi:hypothetical protein
VKKELLGQQVDVFALVENTTNKIGSVKGTRRSIFEVTVVIKDDKLQLYPDITVFLKKVSLSIKQGKLLGERFSVSKFLDFYVKPVLKLYIL